MPEFDEKYSVVINPGDACIIVRADGSQETYFPDIADEVEVSRYSAAGMIAICVLALSNEWTDFLWNQICDANGD